MSSETNNREPWSPCPAGALQSYANQSRTRRWWITVLWTSSVTTLLLCVAGLTIWSVNQRVGSEYRFGGIACPQVRENFIAYQAGTLSDDLSRRIRIHLQKCPECHEFMQNNGGGGKGIRHVHSTGRRWMSSLSKLGDSPCSAGHGCDCFFTLTFVPGRHILGDRLVEATRLNMPLVEWSRN